MASVTWNVAPTAIQRAALRDVCPAPPVYMVN
jgi:hypothetical protein